MPRQSSESLSLVPTSGLAILNANRLLLHIRSSSVNYSRQKYDCEKERVKDCVTQQEVTCGVGAGEVPNIVMISISTPDLITSELNAVIMLY